MRGWVTKQATMLSLVGPEQRVPKNHPIRRIKALADEQLESLSPVFDSMYAELGRPSIPPETLLKGCLLIALFSLRGERAFCERLDYDLMFRFFLDMGLEEQGSSGAAPMCTPMQNYSITTTWRTRDRFDLRSLPVQDSGSGTGCPRDGRSTSSAPEVEFEVSWQFE